MLAVSLVSHADFDVTSSVMYLVLVVYLSIFVTWRVTLWLLAAWVKTRVYERVGFYRHLNDTPPQKLRGIQIYRGRCRKGLRVCGKNTQQSLGFWFWLLLLLYQRLCGDIVWVAANIIRENNAAASCAVLAGLNTRDCETRLQQRAKQPLRQVYWRPTLRQNKSIKQSSFIHFWQSVYCKFNLTLVK